MAAWLVVLSALIAVVAAPAWAAPPVVVAAERVYADIVHQVGGSGVAVRAIIDNPDQDPHLFEADTAAARAVSAASLVIYNGAGYDPWMRSLLAASGGGVRRVIDVADLMHQGAGSDPHLWYDPMTIRVFANTVAHALSDADPPGAAGYAIRLATLDAALDQLDRLIASMRARWHGQPIAATEPVFSRMATRLGLSQRELGFARAVLNGTEPSAADIAGFEADLRGRHVRALLRNIQTDDDATRRLVRLAGSAKVPVVGITETEPRAETYQAWMTSQLAALDHALAAPAP